jgi:hypothetical protein
MRPITSKLHGAIDYATGATLMVAPTALRLRDARASLTLRAAGGGALAYSLLTDYELGVVRRLPLRTHLALDAASGVLLAAAPYALGFRRRGARHWMPHVLVGVGEIAASLLTQPVPQDQQQDGDAGAGPDASGASLSGGPSSAGAIPGPEAGATGTPDASATSDVTDLAAPGTAAAAAAAAAGAAAAEQVPDPSAGGTAPAGDELRAHSHPDPKHAVRPDMSADPLVEEEIRAAEAEAGAIGGRADVIDHDLSPVLDETLSEADRPLAEAGQGYAEGFEQSEADLIESASHGTPSGSPLEDAFSPEVESDRSDARYGEPDELDVTEVVADPAEPEDDPGRSPDISHDR